MRIIFLDIDGVLNSYLYIWSRTKPLERAPRGDYPEWKAQKLLPFAVQTLNIILEEIEAKVVVSSSWRVGHSIEELQEYLNLAGFTGEIIGKTPSLHGKKRRGEEILAWMVKQGVEPEDMVILEDEPLDLYLLCDRVVKTFWKIGLQESHIQEAIDLFQEA